MKPLPLNQVEEICLTVVSGESAGKRIAFAPEVRGIGIGRAVNNDVVVGDPTVSRAHARIEIRDDGCFVCDLGSRTGVEKMGFRVGESLEPIESGDEIKLGETILRFEIVPRAPAGRSAASGGAQQAAAARLLELRKALERLGLRTPAMQLGAGVCVLLIFVLALWPGPPPMPAQSVAPLTVDYAATVGFTKGDLKHLDGAVFLLPDDTEGLGLYLDAFAYAGLEIRSAAGPLASIEPARGWRSYQLLLIPRSITVRGKKPGLIFDNLGYAAAEGPIDLATAKLWGMRGMWVAPVPGVEPSLERLAERLRPLPQAIEHLDDDPAQRHRVVGELRTVLIGLMKLTGRRGLLVPASRAVRGGESLASHLETALAQIEAGQPQSAVDPLVAVIGWVDGDLTRKYRQQRNAALVAKKQEARRAERVALQTILQMIPDSTDPRNREAVEKLRGLGVKG